MARREYRGGAPQLVLSGNLNASGETSINTTGTVTDWPTGATGKFLIVIDKGSAGEEKIFCDGRVGNALSIASDADRGADGTSAASHVSGVTINHVGGAVDLDEPNQHINDAAQDNHTQYIKTDGTRAFSAVTAIKGSPVATGDANADGSGVTLALANHVHKGVVAADAWTSWTPTWTALTVGDGTVVAKYQRTGRKVDFYVRFVMGSTSAMDEGPRFTLPVAASGTYTGDDTVDNYGRGVGYNSGVSQYDMVVGRWDADEAIVHSLIVVGTTIQLAFTASTFPFTWGTNDSFAVWGTYEAAS